MSTDIAQPTPAETTSSAARVAADGASTDSTTVGLGSAVLAAMPERERHLYRIPEAMVLLSMSRSVIYEQIRAGRLRTVTQGRSRLVPKVAIVEYVNLLIRESEGADCDQAS